MPAVLSTVKSVSAPEKSPAQKAPPIPTQQRKEKFVERQERHGRLTMVLTYSFFQGDAKMVNHHHKTNTYNAFKSIKAAELNDG